MSNWYPLLLVGLGGAAGSMARYAAAQAVTGFALAAIFAAAEECHAPVFLAGLALSLLALIPAMSRRP